MIMKENRSYQLILCETKNSLLEALKAKEVAIEISGEIRNQIFEEIKNQVNNTKVEHLFGGASKKIAMLGGVSAIIGLFTGGLSVFAEGIVYSAILGISGLVLDRKTDFEKYEMVILKIHGDERFFLVHNSFDKENDNVEGLEEYKFVEGKLFKCPNCNHKFTKNQKNYNPIKCPKCKKEYICVYPIRRVSKKIPDNNN